MLWIFKIFNYEKATEWIKTVCRDKGEISVDFAVKKGILIKIDEKHFVPTKAEHETSKCTWVLDRIWKLTDKEMQESDLYCRYRYKAHVEECPPGYTGVKEMCAGFNLQ